MGFFFDPAYSGFLDEVARRTPPEATVAMLVPRLPDVYRYQAAYTLAPRRVVDGDRIAEARWVAAWGTERDRVTGGVPIGGGRLLAR